MKELEHWICSTAWNEDYWERVRDRARELNSDGCSRCLDIFIWTCWEHDIHYHTHKKVNGEDIDRATADYIFMRRIQQVKLSPIDPFTWAKFPISWIRYSALRIFGGIAWQK